MTDRKIIVVTGCRDWDDFDAVQVFLLAEFFDHQELVTFVGDCPTGVDLTVRAFVSSFDAVGRKSTLRVFSADWKKNGRSAGPIRNREMLMAAKSLQAEDESEETELECFAFWDGKSRGTLDCITQATGLGISVRVVPKMGAIR